MEARHNQHRLERKIDSNSLKDPSQTPFIPEAAALEGSTPESSNGLPVLSFDALRAEIHGPTPAKMSRADHEFLEDADQTSTYMVLQNLRTPIFRRPTSWMQAPIRVMNRAPAPIVHYGTAPNRQHSPSHRVAGPALSPVVQYPMDVRKPQYRAGVPAIIKRPLTAGTRTQILIRPSSASHPVRELEQPRFSRSPLPQPGVPVPFAVGRPAYHPPRVPMAVAQTATPNRPLQDCPSREAAAAMPSTASCGPSSASYGPSSPAVPDPSAAAKPPFVAQRRETPPAPPNPLSFAGQISAIQNRRPSPPRGIAVSPPQLLIENSMSPKSKEQKSQSDPPKTTTPPDHGESSSTSQGNVGENKSDVSEGRGSPIEAVIPPSPRVDPPERAGPSRQEEEEELKAILPLQDFRFIPVPYSLLTPPNSVTSGNQSFSEGGFTTTDSSSPISSHDEAAMSPISEGQESAQTSRSASVSSDMLSLSSEPQTPSVPQASPQPSEAGTLTPEALEDDSSSDVTIGEEPQD